MEDPEHETSDGKRQKRKAKEAARKKRAALAFVEKRLDTEAELSVKIILVGNSGVGKTSLLARFLDERANISRVELTVLCDFSHCTLRLGERNVQLRIWDTGGMERFNAADLTPNFYRNADGAMLVFSIGDLASFAALPGWLSRVRRGVGAGRRLDCCLVGNKADADSCRLVSRTEAQRLANRLGHPYIETSAENVTNVQKAFVDLTLAVMRRVSAIDDAGSGDTWQGTGGTGRREESRAAKSGTRTRRSCACS